MSDKVQTTTKLDIRCPAKTVKPSGDKRRSGSIVQCERGVGHDGKCQHGNYEWKMQRSERSATRQMVANLASEWDAR